MSLSGSKISFVGKGGAGKTTCLVLLAETLRRGGHEVCVLDTDSTNVGLHSALGIAESPRRLIDYFGGMVFLGGQVACPADDPTLLPNAAIDLANLSSEYVSRNDSGIFLLSAGKLEEFGVGAGCDGPLVKIARDLAVQYEGQPVTLLVDLKAGIEDTSRGVLVGMDQVVVVCDPSTAGLGVAASMKNLLDSLRRGAEPATQHIESLELAELARQLFRQSRLQRMHVLLNRVPDETSEEYMRQVLAGNSIEPTAVIPEVGGLREAWLRGTRLPNDLLTDVLRDVLEGLESEPARSQE